MIQFMLGMFRYTKRLYLVKYWVYFVEQLPAFWNSGGYNIYNG